MGASSSTLIKSETIPMVIARARDSNFNIFRNFFSHENQEQSFLYSFGNFGMLALSIQKSKLKLKEEN